MDEHLYPNFFEAANELDELTLEGFFGEATRKIVEQRDFLSQTDYFVFLLDDWLSDNTQYGKANVKALIILFLQIYIEAIKVDPVTTVDSLATYWTGTKDNPELEGISGYMEAVRFNQEARRALDEIQTNTDRKTSDYKHAMSSSITAYSKMVEYIGQILVPCIRLVKATHGEHMNSLDIMKLTLHNKIKLFNQSSGNKYKLLTDMLNRDIRNADSHLTLRYVVNKNQIEYKKRMGGKLNTNYITIEDWFLSIYPKVGWILQAFVYSSVLLCIGFSDKTRFMEKYTLILTN